ncbi:hypothetical protein V6N13_102304 [Hibiscus sabdariffa]
MKFMKLGSRPDTFYTADAVRSVSSDVSSDLIVQVKGSRYMLHKFPLLSKCLRLQRICSESPETLQHQIVQLPDFPGGIDAFELCAKFCYGITITLSAYNLVAARCAAEYLQMTEDVEKGNLVCKLEVFFNSCILHGWRDSIVTLQSTKAFPLWSEDLRITSRCIEAIALKVSTHPSKVSLSHSQSRRVRDEISCNGKESQLQKPTTKGWWAEDVAELGIDLYWRTMIAIKSDGKMPSNLIGEALQIYASRWLPYISRKVKANKEAAASDSDSDSASEVTSKSRLLLESIVSLLPSEKGSASCSFLLKLLKAAIILNVSSSSRMELARRVALQVEEARVSDLLIPSLSNSSTTLYDVDIVLAILEQFMSQRQSPPTSPPRSKLVSERRRRRSRSAENIDFKLQESRRSSSASHSSKLKVAKLVDGYLQEIARDKNLPLSKFIAVAETIPNFSRLVHDDIYQAIDIYLKAHPDLNKSDRKKLCRVLDCRKLSVEACMHAAQNEKLPLRVVVQVLFFEQARAVKTGGKVTELPGNIKAVLAAHNIDPSKPPGPLSTTTSIPADDQWSISGLKSPKSRLSTLRMKLAEDDDLDENDMNTDVMGRHSKFKGFCALPTNPQESGCSAVLLEFLCLVSLF